MNSNTDSVFSKRGLSWLGLLMVIAVVAGAVVTGFVLMDWPENSRILTPLSLEQIISKPLEAFSFEELSLYEPTVSEIVLEGIITQEPEFTAYLFSYTTQEKKATGQINLPRGYESKQMPVIVMLRGFVDSSIYQTGVGTRNAAAVYASNGFITVAPDFLGYGGSDADDNDSFAARLKRPITVLDLIASVKQLPYIDENSVFMWGHSNGGQIALSILEITQANYPTALWAPVSKPFPYSILYYSDEADDFGKSMRNSLAAFV